MARDPRKNTMLVDLRLAAGTITATTAETAVTDQKLKKARSGILLLAVNAIDTGTGDETYVITLEGRKQGSGDAYAVLATHTITAAGWVAIGVHQLKDDMLLRATLGGTTPTLEYDAALLVTKLTYGLDDGVTIT